MITKRQLRTLTDPVETLEKPILSLYAHVNPAAENNHPKAVMLRAKGSLDGLGVPRAICDSVLSRLSSRSSGARTLAIFANESNLEAFELQLDLPVVDAQTGLVDARWGEPYLSPLMLALDDYERYAVLFVSGEMWRLFEVFVGEIEEVEDALRPVSPGELDKLQLAKKVHPAWVADRGDAARDNAAHHLTVWLHRFNKQAAARLEDIMDERGMGRLIVLGTREDTQLFTTVLSRSVRRRLVEILPSLPAGKRATRSEVLERVRSTIDAVEEREEQAVLDRIREGGIWGVEKCLEELQRGRVWLLAVPWELRQSVYVDRDVGYVSATKNGASAHLPEGTEPAKVGLRDVLPDLSAAFSVQVELMRGKSGERLTRDLGAMGALVRW